MPSEPEKLVRDDVPELIREDGGEPITHTATGDEYAERLAEKLVEEVDEYRSSRELEELVDIVEVVHAIRRYRGHTTAEFERLREGKADRRGRFEDRVVLEAVRSG